LSAIDWDDDCALTATLVQDSKAMETKILGFTMTILFKLVRLHYFE
jgi:hypothetical protein